jgi:hypothetical protein
VLTRLFVGCDDLFHGDLAAASLVDVVQEAKNLIRHRIAEWSPARVPQRELAQQVGPPDLRSQPPLIVREVAGWF